MSLTVEFHRNYLTADKLKSFDRLSDSLIRLDFGGFTLQCLSSPDMPHLNCLRELDCGVCDSERFKAFADKYCNQITKLKLNVGSKTCLRLISQFKSLSELKLCCDLYETELSMIGRECKQLTHLWLDCRFSNTILTTIGHNYMNLKFLFVSLTYSNDFGVDCHNYIALRNCEHLTDLHLLINVCICYLY